MIFADIREAMNIPLVTSIWRVLAGIDGALESTWGLAGPIVRSGQVEASLARLERDVSWPMPAQPIPGGAWRGDLVQIRAVVGAYTRSNSLSLLVLSALVAEPAGERIESPVPPPPGPWPILPPLRAHDEFDAETWASIERVNRIGSTPDQPGVATLWRHLADWPELLAAIETAVAPLEADGVYAEALTQTRAIVGIEAGRLAHLCPVDAVLPAAARTFIEPYVTHPGLVQRMVVIGHILAGWLDRAEQPR